MALYPGSTLFPGLTLFPDSSGIVATPLIPVTVTEAGTVTPAGQSADPSGNLVLWNNGSTMWVELVNTDLNPQSVTITLPYRVKGQQIPSLVISLAAGQLHRRGPFDLTIYGPVLSLTASSSLVQIGAYQTVPSR